MRRSTSGRWTRPGRAARRHDQGERRSVSDDRTDTMDEADMTTMRTTLLDSPLGELRLLAEDGSLTGLYFPDHRRAPVASDAWVEAPQDFAEVSEQLAAYLRGELRRFDLPVRLHGSAFQLAVWERLRDVPYGVTTTYGQLAAAVGRPSASRAVAAAVARNPVSIVVPCHRVVGAGGTLTGYAGGVERKAWLLALEAGQPA
jgi:methylated-DNA-[protein]-cysteine S-methyltransferase